MNTTNGEPMSTTNFELQVLEGTGLSETLFLKLLVSDTKVRENPAILENWKTLISTFNEGSGESIDSIKIYREAIDNFIKRAATAAKNS